MKSANLQIFKTQLLKRNFVTVSETFDMTNRLRDKELDALVSLLDEPDDRMFGQVRDKLYTYGKEAIPVLEDAWLNFFDSNIQQRIESIIHHIQFDFVYNELIAWKNSGMTDLLKGFTLVARYQYPNLDEKSIIENIGKIIQDVWLEINSNLTPLEKIKVINHIFFDVHGFHGNKKNLMSPHNSFINNIFETKRANPISLSIIYMVVAQSLKIPVYGINLPQNFIVAYMSSMMSDYNKVTPERVQFYLNVFNSGVVFTRKEIELFLRQINLEYDDKYFLPCDNATIIKRVFNNLIMAYEDANDPVKVDEIKKLQSALD